MMRVVTAVVVAALAAGAYLVPAQPAPEPGLPATVDPPAVAICAIEEGSGRSTSVGVVSAVNGMGTLTAFAGGRGSESVEFDTGTSASATIDIVDVAAIGVAGALVEVPSSVSGVAAVVTGQTSLSAEGCQATPEAQTLITGGATVSGETFEVQLMNPYAGEAVVDLIVQSESGLESSGELEAIVVPARASVVVDLTEVLPGRERLNVLVEARLGSVVAVGRHGALGDSAVVAAVPPAQDWFLPVPGTPGSRQILIANASSVAVDFQVDLYGSDGLEEAFVSGTLPARGIERIGVGRVTQDPAALRVVTTGPVAAFVARQTSDSVSLTAGATTPSDSWFLPSAGSIPGSTGTVVVFNPGIEDSTFTLTARRFRSAATQHSVAAGTVVELNVADLSADGYVVDADRPLVVLWTTQFGPGRSMSIATPVISE